MAKTVQEISLHIKFSEKDSKLVIRTDRVTGLPHRTDGKAHNTYVKLFLVPKIAEMIPREAKNTEIKREADEPIFRQEIKYEDMSAHELINSVLHVEVLEYSCLQKHQVLGEADLPLAQVQFVQGDATMTLQLVTPVEGESNGTILMSLAYMHDIHELNVWLIKCNGLNKGDNSRTDVQAKVWLSMNGKLFLDEKYTKTISSSASPCFNNEKFSWTVDPSLLQNIAIHAAVLNQHPECPQRRCKLGHVTISKQQTRWTRRMHWATFTNTPNSYTTDWHELVKEELATQQEDKPSVTLAQLQIQVEYKTVREILTLKIEKAHWCQEEGTLFSSFVQASMIPELPDTCPRAEKMTNVVIAEDLATFNEEVRYEAMGPNEFFNSILQLELIDQHFIGENLVLGQKCLPLAEVPLVQGKAKLNILLDPPMRQSCVLVSLAYNREEQIFSVSLIMAKYLNYNYKETEVYAKMQVNDGSEVYGEITTQKKKPPNCAPIFRETLACHLLEAELNHVYVHIMLFNESSPAGSYKLGEVTLSTFSMGEVHKHWKKFLLQPNKTSIGWHILSQESKEMPTAEILRSLPLISHTTKVLPQSGKQEHRHSLYVTEADEHHQKFRPGAEHKCSKPVSQLLRSIDRQRSWSDTVKVVPQCVIESLVATSKQSDAALSLCLAYNEEDALLSIEILTTLRLQCNVFADVAQERLARIAHRIASHAIIYVFLRPSTAIMSLRRSKKTGMKKLAEETQFFDEIHFEAVSREELENSTLHVIVLGCDFEKNLVLGQVQFTSKDIEVKGEEVATTVMLERPVEENLGNVRLSLMYQPETKQLVVILLRAMNLNNGNSQDTDAQAKIWMILDSDVVLGETYSNTFKKSCSPFFNKTLSVTVEPAKIRNVAICISIHNKRDTGRNPDLGYLKLSGTSQGEDYRHWNDAITSPGERLMEWHQLHAHLEMP